MIGYKLNSAGDIDVDSNGKIQLLSTIQEAVRQRLDIQHKTFQGEWFLDVTFGVPYRQQIIGKGLSKAEIDALYITIINNDPDVLSIRYFQSEYDALAREYSLVYEVVTSDGVLRADTANLYPAEEVEYPVPDNFALEPNCDNKFLTWVADIHPTLHNDLPLGGQYTWIYGSYVEDGYVDAGYFIQ